MLVIFKNKKTQKANMLVILKKIRKIKFLITPSPQMKQLSHWCIIVNTHIFMYRRMLLKWIHTYTFHPTI